MVRAAPAPFPERGFLLGRLSNAGLTMPCPPRARGRRPKPFTKESGPGRSRRTSDRYASLAQPFHAPLEIGGVAEWQDAAAALHREVGIDPDRLFPGFLALLGPPEMPVAGGKQGV